MVAPNSSKKITSLSSTAVLTEKGQEITFVKTIIHSGDKGRTSRYELSVYVAFEENANVVERIVHRIKKIDHRAKTDSLLHFTWHGKKPGVFSASVEHYNRGEGSETRSTLDSVNDGKLSRPIDPDAVLAALNVGNDGFAAQFLYEYLPPELGTSL